MAGIATFANRKEVHVKTLVSLDHFALQTNRSMKNKVGGN